MNFSDRWLATAAEQFSAPVDMFAPRQVFLDAALEIFALVSPEDYAWATQWRWKWNWDRTMTKRYAIRCTWIDGRRATVYLHKEICGRKSAPPSELHHIGDHQNGESLDCQRGNMEWATKSMNRRNRKRGPR